MTRVRRLTLAALLSVVALGTFAPAASAHAGLVSSDPADGAVLDSAPAAVTMTFSEPPDLSPGFSTFTLLNATGATIPTPPAREGAGAKEVELPLPADLADGVYTVSFRVTSATDGHVTGDSIAFGIGVTPDTVPAPSGPSSGSPPPSPLAVAAKVLLYAGLAVLVGSVAVALLAFGGLVPARRALFTTAGGLALSGAALMFVAETETVGVSIGKLIGSPTGAPFVWLLIGGLVTGATALVASTTRSKGPLVAVGLAAAATMFIRVRGGHAAEGDPEWLEVLMQWIHFLAVGVWVGGFVPVLLLLRDRRHVGVLPTKEVRAYSRLAGYALATVAITGVLRAVSELGGWSSVTSILDTSYGLSLTIKVGIVVVLIGLGTWNRYRSIPRQDGFAMLRRVMRAEVVTAVGVFAMTGVLTGLPPNPPGPVPAPTAQHIMASGSDFATTMKVTLTATPGKAGPNAFEVTVDDYDTGASLNVSGVSLSFALQGRPGVGGDLDLTGGSPGDWSGDGTQMSIAGTWTVTVLVQQGAEAVQIPLSLTTLMPEQQLTVTPATDTLPALYTMTLPSGDQIQAYNDPGTVGKNELHLTAFSSDGNELPLKHASVTATPAGGDPERLKLERLSPGHFAANADLTTGDWHFDIEATSLYGAALQAYFDQSIGG